MANYLDATSPIQGGADVTPSDTVDFTQYARALWIGTGGNIAVVTVGGDVLTLVGAQTGSILPIQTKRVNSTDTTAADIVALW